MHSYSVGFSSLAHWFGLYKSVPQIYEQLLDKIPTAHFDYRKFPPEERLEAWRQMTASLYQTWARDDPLKFRADAYGYQVGELVFNQVEFSPARFWRSPNHLQGDSKDFLSLQMQLKGEERLVMAHGQVRILAGNIYLRDWAHEFDSDASEMYLYSIVIPRHRLSAGAAIDPHNPIMSWSMSEPVGRMLTLLWTELLAEMEKVTLAQAKILSDAFLGYLDTLLGYGASEVAPATLGVMQHYVMTRLRGNITIEELSQHFSVSRSTIYRLFQPLGGFKRYINTARLERCYADLRRADPTSVRVSDVANSWGFTQASSFTRRFRSRFGVPPTQVIGSGRDLSETSNIKHELLREDLTRDYMGWLQQASGRANDIVDED